MQVQPPLLHNSVTTQPCYRRTCSAKPQSTKPGIDTGVRRVWPTVVPQQAGTAPPKFNATRRARVQLEHSPTLTATDVQRLHVARHPPKTQDKTHTGTALVFTAPPPPPVIARTRSRLGFAHGVERKSGVSMFS